MRVLFIISILFSALCLSAQGADITLPVAPVAAETAQATNISVGEFSVQAFYPEQVEFILWAGNSQLVVSTIDDDGESRNMLYPALVTQIAQHVYRAEIDTDTWVEVNTATGFTFVHQNCQTRVFTPTKGAATASN